MKDSADIKAIVKEVSQGFSAMWDLMDHREDQLYCTDAYISELEAGLDPAFTQQIAHPSRRLSHAAWETQGILRQSFNVHVEGKPETKADHAELFFAHCWYQVDGSGQILTPTNRMQTVQPYACWWREFEPYTLPTEAEKREEYKEGYGSKNWPFKLRVISGRGVSFLPGDDGQPTIAVIEQEISYVEVVKRYGKKGSDRSPLTILGEEFEYLRGARSTGVDQGDMFGGKKAKVCIVDDGNTISHWIEVGDRGGKRYEAVSKDGEGVIEVPNPWGSVSLRLVFGRFNSDAKELVNMYEPLIVDLARQQRNVDVTSTHIVSVGLTPTKFGITPSADGDMGVSAIEFSEGIARMPGDVTPMRTELDPIIDTAFQHQLAERDACLPPPFLTNPDQAMLKGAVGSALLNAHETSNRMYDSARESVIGGVMWYFEGIKHFVCGGHLNGPKPDEARDYKEEVNITLTGKEPSRKFAGSEKGKGLHISKDSLEFEHVIEISPLPQTEGQKAAKFELQQTITGAGAGTMKDLVAATTEDVSGKIEEIEEEKRYQIEAPALIQLDFLYAIQVIKEDSGRDLAPLYIAAGLIPGGGESPQDEAGGPGGGMGGFRQDPPRVATPAVSVTG